ncbi:hypothetical protein [Yersinia vastinensis]|nr:hypothetical protein [Yersinia vastinensis]
MTAPLTRPNNVIKHTLALETISLIARKSNSTVATITSFPDLHHSMQS